MGRPNSPVAATAPRVAGSVAFAVLAVVGSTACIGQEEPDAVACQRELERGHGTVWSVDARSGQVGWTREVALVEPWPDVRDGELRLIRTDGKGTVRLDASSGEDLPTLLELPSGDHETPSDDDEAPVLAATPGEALLDGVVVPDRVAVGDVTFDAGDTAGGTLVARAGDGAPRWELDLDRDRAGAPVVLDGRVLVVTADERPASCR
ncbi:MAG: PQQ-like beta-propeller repeat protein [Acidimicrobiales bacterium]|nr:PQQ-like beta-propeller repeat protein [Acidimicrobiales bacterium]